MPKEWDSLIKDHTVYKLSDREIAERRSQRAPRQNHTKTASQESPLTKPEPISQTLPPSSFSHSKATVRPLSTKAPDLSALGRRVPVSVAPLVRRQQDGGSRGSPPLSPPAPAMDPSERHVNLDGLDLDRFASLLTGQPREEPHSKSEDDSLLELSIDSSPCSQVRVIPLDQELKAFEATRRRSDSASRRARASRPLTPPRTPPRGRKRPNTAPASTQGVPSFLSTGVVALERSVRRLDPVRSKARQPTPPEDYGGYTERLVEALSRLTGHLQDSEERAKHEMQQRAELHDALTATQACVQKLESGFAKLQEENAELKMQLGSINEAHASDLETIRHEIDSLKRPAPPKPAQGKWSNGTLFAEKWTGPGKPPVVAHVRTTG